MIAEPINLTAEERESLERLVRSSTAEQRLVFRARLILVASQGLESKEVARQLGCRAATVSKWRRRYLEGSPKQGGFERLIERWEFTPVDPTLFLDLEQGHF